MAARLLAALGLLGAQVHGDEARLRAVVESLAAVESRLSGYPGSEVAADLVQRELERSGVERVTREVFQVTVPVDRGGELRVPQTGERYLLRALWPNQVQAPTLPDGLEAPLVYGGHGEYRDFDGKELHGSVVLMEFNSWAHWLRAASLGARAVVFVEPDHTTWSQASDKCVQVPLDLPRFWIGREDGARLRARLAAGSLAVALRSRVDWEQRPTCNVWGVVPGRDPSLAHETIVVETYYDGASVVPALAPAAEAASGIAALLELARHLQSHPPGRTLALVATAAHFQGRRGIVEFLERHARRHEYYAQRMAAPLGPRLFIGLDLSSQTDQLGIWNNTASFELKRFFVPFGRRFTAYAAEEADRQGRGGEQVLVNGISPLKGVDWSSYVPGGVSTNGQVVLDAGQVALSLVTVHDARFAVDTPLDVPARVRYDNLERQSRLINALVGRASSDPGLFSGLEDFAPVLKDNLRSLRAKVRTFPRRSQVPDRPVPGALVVVGWGEPPHKGVRRTRYYLADAEGCVDVAGLPLGSTAVAAYALHPGSGVVRYAPDLSEAAQRYHGAPTATGGLATDIRWTTHEKLVVVFPCLSRAMYGLIDARSLAPLRSAKVLDPSGAAPRQYGVALGGGTADPMGVVFGPAEEGEDPGLKLLLGDSMMLINSQGGRNEEEARGRGYRLGREELVPTELLAVQDMWHLNEARLQTMRVHAIENQRLTRLHEQARAWLADAAAARQERQWGRYVASVRAARGMAARAYPDVLGTLNDIIRGIVFFLALVLPAAFFGERLLFAAPDIRWQLAGFGLLLLPIWGVISQVHPAFAIAHPLVILLAFAIMAMALFVFLMILGRFNRHVREHRARAARVYETDISRASAAYTAFMLGVSNMRRRRLRTGLTLLTLVLLTFSVLSFTSFRPQIGYLAVPTPYSGTYEGVLIRDRGWEELGLPTLDYAQSHFGPHGVIGPRGWYWPSQAAAPQGEAQGRQIEVRRGGAFTQAAGLLGLSPREPQITGIDRALQAGSYFTEEDEASCLLPDDMAQALGIGPADVGQARVQVFGRELTVRGIVDARALEALRDLDREPLTPVDFLLSASEVAGPAPRAQSAAPEPGDLHAMRPFLHVPAANVLIVPYGTLREAGGTLRSVAVRFATAGTGQALVEDFVTRLAITLFAGLRQPGDAAIRVYSYTSLGLTTVEGLGALVVPILIAALIVLNAMLGAVYERMREIGIYSSVGLAPSHIALLFVAEACVVAVIGVTLGYLLGQGLGKVLIALGWLRGVNLNYSSLAAITCALLVMAVVMLSTLYPAHAANRAALPDIARRWVLPPPQGDRWVFAFPFMISRAEVLGMCGFLRNYFTAYSQESIGTFYARQVRIVAEESPPGPEYGLQLLLWLAPFDLGVSQYLQLEFAPSAVPGMYAIEVYVQRLSGQDTFWRRLNYRFMNGLRKEFLIWHTLSAEARRYHWQTAEELLGAGAADRHDRSRA